MHHEMRLRRDHANLAALCAKAQLRPDELADAGAGRLMRDSVSRHLSILFLDEITPCHRSSVRCWKHRDEPHTVGQGNYARTPDVPDAGGRMVRRRQDPCHNVPSVLLNL